MTSIPRQRLSLGQQRTPLLVRPHSKVVLREAIKIDLDFLAKSNIMDYSCALFFSPPVFLA